MSQETCLICYTFTFIGSNEGGSQQQMKSNILCYRVLIPLPIKVMGFFIGRRVEMSNVYLDKSLEGTKAIWELLSSFNEIVYLSNPELVNENANMNASTPMGQMGKFASEGARFFARENLLSAQVKEAMEANLLYPHDLDFMATGTTTCCQIPLGQMLSNGFDTGHGGMRPPKDIASAMALASISSMSRWGVNCFQPSMHTRPMASSRKVRTSGANCTV